MKSSNKLVLYETMTAPIQSTVPCAAASRNIRYRIAHWTWRTGRSTKRSELRTPSPESFGRCRAGVGWGRPCGPYFSIISLGWHVERSRSRRECQRQRWSRFLGLEWRTRRGRHSAWPWRRWLVRRNDRRRLRDMWFDGEQFLLTTGDPRSALGMHFGPARDKSQTNLWKCCIEINITNLNATTTTGYTPTDAHHAFNLKT